MSEIPSNKPVRIKDVYNALGIEGGSRGRDLGYACSNAHGRTNKWARFKPVVPATDTPCDITPAQIKAVSYGLVPTVDGAADTAIVSNGLTLTAANIARLGRLTWSYRAPAEGNFMRLTDWLGYEHRAAAPMTPPGDVEFGLNETTTDVRLLNNQPITVNNLTAADFPWVSGKYLCMVVWREKKSDGSVTVAGFKTASGTIDTTSGQSISLTKNEVTFASPTLYTTRFLLCLSTARNTGVFVNSDTRLYPLVSDAAPTGEIIVSRDAPLTFVPATGQEIAHLPTNMPRPLSDYALASVTSAKCLGVGSDGTITLFGRLTNKGTKSVTLGTTRPIQARLTPSLSGTGGNVRARLWFKGSDGTYTLSTSAISLAAGASIDVALEFTGIAFIPDEGGAQQHPSREYVMAQMRMSYVNAASADESGFMWGTALNVSQPADLTVTYDGHT